MHISKIYAAELDDRNEGYALWFPDGTRNSGEVEVGDVGWISDGAFIQRFNALSPENGTDVPPGQRALRYHMFYDERDELPSGMYKSRSVHVTKAKVALQGEAPGAGSAALIYKIKCSEERGSFFHITHPAQRKVVLNGRPMLNLFKQHYKSWHNYYAGSYGIGRNDLIMVTGFTKTAEWTVAAVRSVAVEQTVAADASAGFIATGGIGFELLQESATGKTLEHRTNIPSGRPILFDPRTELYEIQDSPDSFRVNAPTSAASSTASELHFDQCLFLRFYKMRLRIGPIMVAGAGPHQLPSYQDDEMTGVVLTESQSDYDVVAESVPQPEPDLVTDSLDMLLEYMLETSDADAAVACHEDLEGLWLGQESPQDIAQYLRERRPQIYVEEDGTDKVAMFHPDELTAIVVRQRLQEYESLWQKAHDADAGLMAIDEQHKSTVRDEIEGAGTGEGSSSRMDEGIDHREVGPSEGQFGSGDENHDHLKGDGGYQRLVTDGQLVLGNRPEDSKPIEWPHLSLLNKSAEITSVGSVVLSPDGKWVAAGFEYSIIQVWDTRSGQEVYSIDGQSEDVWSIAFSPDSNALVAGLSDARVVIWGLGRASDTSEQVLEGHYGDVFTVAYSPNGTYIASGSADCFVKLWDLFTEECCHTLEGHTEKVTSVIFTSDNTRVISCAGPLGIIWDIESGDQLATLDGHTDAIWSIAISLDGDRVVTGSQDTTSRIWDSETGSELVTLAGHSNPVMSVAFSPDGKTVATGSYDETIIISDSFTGEQLYLFDKHQSEVDTVAYSHDGQFLASGSADGHVKLWDTVAGEFIAEFHGHKDKVKSVVFTQDGRDVFSSSDDGTVRKWSVRDAVRLY